MRSLTLKGVFLVLLSSRNSVSAQLVPGFEEKVTAYLQQIAATATSGTQQMEFIRLQHTAKQILSQASTGNPIGQEQ